MLPRERNLMNASKTNDLALVILGVVLMILGLCWFMYCAVKSRNRRGWDGSAFTGLVGFVAGVVVLMVS